MSQTLGFSDHPPPLSRSYPLFRMFLCHQKTPPPFLRDVRKNVPKLKLLPQSVARSVMSPLSPRLGSAKDPDTAKARIKTIDFIFNLGCLLWRSINKLCSVFGLLFNVLVGMRWVFIETVNLYTMFLQIVIFTYHLNQLKVLTLLIKIE